MARGEAQHGPSLGEDVMRMSLIHTATELFRETPAEALPPEPAIRWCAYVEAIGACTLLVIAGVALAG